MPESGETGSKNREERKKNIKARLSMTDFLSPNATRIDITIGIPEEVLEVAATLQSKGVDLEVENIGEILSSYAEGIDWALNKYNYTQKPKFSALKNIKGNLPIVSYSRSHDEIFLNIDSFKKYKGKSLDKPYPLKYKSRFELPKTLLTPRQLAEIRGVEETIHYLANRKIEGLSLLPDDYAIYPEDVVDHYTQPHELDALRLSGEFLQEKYGENPLLGLQELMEKQIAK